MAQDLTPEELALYQTKLSGETTQAPTHTPFPDLPSETTSPKISGWQAAKAGFGQGASLGLMAPVLGAEERLRRVAAASSDLSPEEKQAILAGKEVHSMSDALEKIKLLGKEAYYGNKEALRRLLAGEEVINPEESAAGAQVTEDIQRGLGETAKQHPVLYTGSMMLPGLLSGGASALRNAAAPAASAAKMYAARAATGAGLGALSTAGSGGDIKDVASSALLGGVSALHPAIAPAVSGAEYLSAETPEEQAAALTNLAGGVGIAAHGAIKGGMQARAKQKAQQILNKELPAVLEETYGYHNPTTGEGKGIAHDTNLAIENAQTAAGARALAELKQRSALRKVEKEQALAAPISSEELAAQIQKAKEELSGTIAEPKAPKTLTREELARAATQSTENLPNRPEQEVLASELTAREAHPVIEKQAATEAGLRESAVKTQAQKEEIAYKDITRGQKTAQDLTARLKERLEDAIVSKKNAEAKVYLDLYQQADRLRSAYASGKADPNTNKILERLIDRSDELIVKDIQKSGAADEGEYAQSKVAAKQETIDRRQAEYDAALRGEGAPDAPMSPPKELTAQQQADLKTAIPQTIKSKRFALEHAGKFANEPAPTGKSMAEIAKGGVESVPQVSSEEALLKTYGKQIEKVKKNIDAAERANEAANNKYIVEKEKARATMERAARSKAVKDILANRKQQQALKDAEFALQKTQEELRIAERKLPVDKEAALRGSSALAAAPTRAEFAQSLKEAQQQLPSRFVRLASYLGRRVPLLGKGVPTKEELAASESLKRRARVGEALEQRDRPRAKQIQISPQVAPTVTSQIRNANILEEYLRRKKEEEK